MPAASIFTALRRLPTGHANCNACDAAANGAVHGFAQGMDFTTDKLRSLVRKWQTLIEAHVDVKTTDGYVLRLFCISFTKKRMGQVRPVS